MFSVTGRVFTSPYTAVEEAKTTLFTLFFTACSNRFKVPVTLTSWVNLGSVTEEVTSIKAAKCTIASMSVIAGMVWSRMSPFMKWKFLFSMTGERFSSLPV